MKEVLPTQPDEDIEKVLSEKILKFYDNIDKKEYGLMFESCDEQIVYERDGLENNGHLKLEGLDAFKKFYNSERKITGVHHTESVQNDGNGITVFGSLEGTYNETQIKLRYKDTWVFNAQGKVTFRLTQIVKQS